MTPTGCFPPRSLPRSTCALACSVLSWRWCLAWCSALHRRGTRVDWHRPPRDGARPGRQRRVVGAPVPSSWLGKSLLQCPCSLARVCSFVPVGRGQRPSRLSGRKRLAAFVDPLGGRYPTKESLMQFFRAIERKPWPPATFAASPGRAPYRSASPRSDRLRLRSRVIPPWTRTDGRPQLPNCKPQLFQHARSAGRRRRAFTDADTTDSLLVCLVNEAFVRRHLQGRPVIGARVAVRSPASGLIQARESWAWPVR